jgi:hypothetical protein
MEKAKIAMISLVTFDILENKMNTFLNALKGDLSKSITGCEFNLNAFYGVFKN